MNKDKIISVVLTIVGFAMIGIAIFLQNEKSLSVEEIDIKNMAASANMYVKDETVEENQVMVFEEVEMETTPVSIDIPPRTEIYDGLTLEELSAKIDRNLGDGYIAGKGELIASYCIEMGVDPYIATAIILHETGCNATCSKLVRYCNNVGGQKGSPRCGNGSYRSFPTLDDGIKEFVNNLYKNYYSYGLTTIEQIAPKYAEGNTWAGKINWYVEKIKNS